MSMLTDEQLADLYLDLVEWLYEATTEDILEYARRSELTVENYDQIAPDIIDRAKWSVRLFYRDYVGLADISSVSFLDSVEMVANFSQYSTASVASSFSQKTGLLPHPVSGDIHEPALKVIRFWNNCFAFLTSKSYLDRSVYIRSFTAMAIPDEMLANWLTVAQELVAEVGESLKEHNYEPHFLSQPLKEKMQGFLTGLGIFPKELSEEQASKLIDKASLVFIVDLKDVLDYVTTYQQAKGTQGTIDDLLALYWSDMQLRKKIEVIGRAEAVQLAEKEVVLDPIYTQLLTLITIDTISSGRAQEQLHTYFHALQPDQKEHFRTILSDFLTTSPFIQNIFEGVDVEFFLNKLRTNSYTGNKGDFINELEPKVDPALWPITRKLMLLVAGLY